MNFLFKLIMVILLVGIPLVLFKFYPGIAICLGILFALFVMVGLIMDDLNNHNNQKFSITPTFQNTINKEGFY